MPPIAIALVITAALLHVAYFLALLRGYRLPDLTVVYPVARGSGPLLSSFGAIALLGERLSLAGALAFSASPSACSSSPAGRACGRRHMTRRSAERRAPGVHTSGMKTSNRSLVAIAFLWLAACTGPQVPGGDQQQLNDAIRSRPIVLLGETHDNAAQHAMRAQALRALLESGARPALLMEQFDRERQADLDRTLARPGATADDVIAAATPAHPAMQGWSWPFYKPYIALAIEYRLPIVAANVSRDDTRRVLKEGLPALGFDARVPGDIRSEQAAEIADSHCGMLDAETAGRMVGAQVARDQFMARAIEANAARGAVLIAGNGHVRRDVGVPRWLNEATRARSVSIGLLEPDSLNATAFDRAFTTPAQPRSDPCEGMRAAPKR